MPVVPYSLDLRQDIGVIHAFLTRCYHQAVRDSQPKIATLCVEMPPIDPLLVLERLGGLDEHHVYFEHPLHQRATAALGGVLCHESSGPNRFTQARRFVQRWTQQAMAFTPSALTASPPQAQFFCSFTFFDQTSQALGQTPGARVVLPAWQVSRHQHHYWLTANLVVTPEVAVDDLTQRVMAQVQKLNQLAFIPRQSQPITRPAQAIGEAAAIAGDAFQRSVTQALQHISRDRLRKIVLAHALDLKAPQPFQVFQSLRKLRQQYPDCHVFSVGSGDSGTFIGASPERLLSLHHRRLITDALAGSAPRGNRPESDRALADSLLHSAKERDEHQFVVDFLVQQLTGLGLHPSYGITPTLLRLSNIQHLHTPIHAIVPPGTHPLQLVEALHPTPAVAGVPTQAACERIREYETFDRGLYAAPLGWIDCQGNSEFIVGIRSALIQGTRARLYAGAGIVAGSDPEKELAEIRLKLRALGEALV